MVRSSLARVAWLLLAGCAGSAARRSGYADEIEKWRANRERKLRAPDGWLAVVGLFWLEEGVSRFGSAPDNEVVFPAGAAPALAGTFERRGRVVTVKAQAGVDLRVGDAPAQTRELRSDAAGEPDVLALGRLRFFVIERGERIGVRLRDPESPARATFAGLSWYPVDERFRVTARFEPYTDGRTLSVPNVLGDVEPMPSPGRAVFQIDGKEVALDAVLEEPDATELFFVFADATTERGTYPGGRFLYAEMPRDGKVVLDFNKAYSPPCAFTEFATCPVPPKENRLAVPITAGEKFAAH